MCAVAPFRTPVLPVVADAQLRDLLTIALTLVTGATDAVAFLRLGNVFTSVMTGNMVLLGLAAGRGELTALEHTGLAVAAFIAGTVIGSHLAGAPRDEDAVWPRQLSLALLTPRERRASGPSITALCSRWSPGCLAARPTSRPTPHPCAALLWLPRIRTWAA